MKKKNQNQGPLEGTADSITPRINVSSNELKAKFAARSIPLEGDFANLIDMADAGCRALGQGKGQTGPGAGLQLDTISGLLSAKTDTAAGLSVSTSGVGINTAVSKGLAVSSAGLTVQLDG
ncbi:hypothetical protein NK214_24300, partial [Chromobacterium sp. S0633]|uniref:hypothetical protein n=1 Tax=Chromobacterium sp. S0633 TaxID=2957805 RepID=UPI00209F47F5